MKSVEGNAKDTRQRITRPVLIALGACLVLALAVRVCGISFGLPHRYHSDEAAYVVATLEMGQGNLKVDYPPFSPSVHQILMFGLFGFWFLAQLLTGKIDSPAAFAQQYKIDPSGFYLIARGLTVTASLAALLMLFWLVRRVRGTASALVSVLFLGLCFLDVRHAHFVEPHALVALLGLITCYTALSYVSTGKTGWLVGMGLACGAAIGLRYSVSTMALVPGLAFLLRARANGRSKAGASARHLALLGAAAAVGVVIGTPALLVNPANVEYGLRGQAALALTTTSGFGGFDHTEWSTWEFYGRVLELAWGWPLLIAAVIGLARAVRRHGSEDLLLLAFPVTFAAVLLTASAASSAFARYLVPILPFFALYAADGVVAVVGVFARRWTAARRRAALALVAGLLVVAPAVRIARLDYLWLQTDTRTLGKQWIEEHIPAGSKIALQWYTPVLATAGDPEPNSRHIYDAHLFVAYDKRPEVFSLDAYRAEGYEYLVLSSYVYRMQRHDPLEQAQRNAFYQSLDSQARLLAQFNPTDGPDEATFVFEELYSPIFTLWERARPGPTIKIYDLTP